MFPFPFFLLGTYEIRCFAFVVTYFYDFFIILNNRIKVILVVMTDKYRFFSWNCKAAKIRSSGCVFWSVITYMFFSGVSWSIKISFSVPYSRFFQFCQDNWICNLDDFHLYQMLVPINLELLPNYPLQVFFFWLICIHLLYKMMKTIALWKGSLSNKKK